MTLLGAEQKKTGWRFGGENKEGAHSRRWAEVVRYVNFFFLISLFLINHVLCTVQGICSFLLWDYNSRYLRDGYQPGRYA